MDRAERAVELKHGRHNCCQAVLLAFSDVVDLDEKTLDALGSAFGIGMGHMEGTCGALVAAEMLLGLTRFEGKPVLRDAGTIQAAFSKACGATKCADLKGRDTHVVLTECDDCVRAAVKIAEERLGL